MSDVRRLCLLLAALIFSGAAVAGALIIFLWAL